MLQELQPSFPPALPQDPVHPAAHSKDYTLSRSYYQIKLPIDLEPMIPNNDPVRLLNACVEGMDLSELYKTYTRVPKNLATWGSGSTCTGE